MTEDSKGSKDAQSIDAAVLLPATARRAPVSYAIFRVARLTRMIGAGLLRPVGLYPGQEIVMMYLWDLGPQRQVDLVRLTSSDAATMTRMIRRLEHAGFVRRSPSTEDKRAFLIEATPASRGLRKQIEEIWSQIEEITVGGLSNHDRQAVLRVVEDLENRLARAASL